MATPIIPITVYYSPIAAPDRFDGHSDDLKQMPESWQRGVLKYTQPADRWRALRVRQLLQKALRQMGLHHALDAPMLTTPDYHRPYLEGQEGLDFNFAHTPGMAACVVASGVRMGLDVEAVRPVEMQPFRNVMTTLQWQQVQQAAEPLEAFFDLWSFKEAVIKADGRGVYAPYQHMEEGFPAVVCDGRLWYVQPLNCGAGFSAHIATDRPVVVTLSRL